MKKLSLLIVFLLTASWNIIQSQSVNHWETAVYNTDVWRYFVGTSEPDAAWRSITFNDAGWSFGPGGFGYGDNDDNTVIPQCNSVFLRISFNVADTAMISRAVLNIDYDDAFVAYINDVEIARSGITGVHPPFSQFGVDHEAKMYAGGVPESFYIEKNLLKTCLVPGKNILSIQVHNSSATSSDMSSNAFLSFGKVNATAEFRVNPSWFIAPFDFSSSNLPILMINTDGNVDIPDSPRVPGNMKIINRGTGSRNYLSDQNTTGFLNYNGRINIEVRGSASQVLPKKQYGFSTLKADNISNNNVVLLGMPADNDWILNGLGFEPSLIRDYLNYNLARMIGDYASRTAYCEVVLNGSYQGLYVLEEKIKQGSDRVDVTKIGTGDNTFPNVTGGYITKADKLTGGDPIAWTMPSYISLNGVFDVMFIHELPKPENVTSNQNNYIHAEFDKLASSAHSGNISFADGFPSVIDIPSFVDFMIINELSANADAYQYSTFFHKDRNGKLRAGPIWDLNLTYGYDLAIWGFDRSKTYTWQFSNGDNEGPKFWKDLFNNTEFRCCLSRRWNQLIQPGQPLNYTSIAAYIDQIVPMISEAVIRENTKWGTVPGFSNEITKIKDFIKLRIDWMTAAIGPPSNCSAVETPPLVISKIMYNPGTSVAFPVSSDQEFIEIKNNGSTTVDLTGVYFSGTGFVYQFPAYSEIFPNSVKVLANKPEVFKAKYGFPPSGQFTRNLSNTGENLVLADGFGNVIDNVQYSNSLPWPNADGNGSYLELTDPSLDNNLASSWIASSNTIVSVENIRSEQLLNIYPSPVKNTLTVESSGRMNILQLFDSQGRLLRNFNVNSGKYSIDMTSLSPGMYILKVISSERNYMRKIIKE